MKCWTIKLPSNLLEQMDKAYNKATGGFQGHAKMIMLATTDGHLEVNDELIGQTYRYAFCYGKGGWQNVCKALLSAIALHLTPESKP